MSGTNSATPAFAQAARGDLAPQGAAAEAPTKAVQRASPARRAGAVAGAPFVDDFVAGRTDARPYAAAMVMGGWGKGAGLVHSGRPASSTQGADEIADVSPVCLPAPASASRRPT